ncbi:hypothetical protein F5879DRAFT_1072667 [Lentinula edodes]|nr:hypothetical protein F5879DRAFT_1072667 [Lentinula edodes]
MSQQIENLEDALESEMKQRKLDAKEQETQNAQWQEQEIPANKVTQVFKQITSAFGIEVKGDVLRHSMGRIAKEGGVASKLQFGKAVLDPSTKGITISGDGTTHKNETYKTKQATVIQADQKLQFFLGLKMAVNHTSETQALIQQVGGPAAWEVLTPEERSRHLEAMRNRIIHNIGEAKFAKLLEAEKAEVDFFLWAGCCMHKEMNTFKGGCISLDNFWKEHPELELQSYFQIMTMLLLSTKQLEQGQLIELSSVQSMAQSRKWGQQDTLQFFFDHKLGFNFLMYVKQNKGSMKLNHMEQNVFDGLQDIPTRHEFVVITLYWLAISVPYMREIRGPYVTEDITSSNLDLFINT